MRRRCGWDADAIQRFEYEVAFGEPRKHISRRRWSDARQKLEHAEPSHGVSWVLGPTKHAQDVFNMCGFEELQTAVFHERDISSGELDLERGAVVGRSEQDCLALKSMPASRCSRMRSTTY